MVFSKRFEKPLYNGLKAFTKTVEIQPRSETVARQPPKNAAEVILLVLKGV
jgi:hypothetical protein